VNNVGATENIKTENTKLRDHNAYLRNQIDDIFADNARLEDENEMLRDENSTLKTILLELRDQLKFMSSTIATGSMNAQDLNAMIEHMLARSLRDDDQPGSRSRSEDEIVGPNDQTSQYSIVESTAATRMGMNVSQIKDG
jgi:chromosome segregation ATPase